MAEGDIQLPVDGAGKQIRTEVGDGTNLIPSGVHTEVVAVSDAQGVFAGDARQLPVRVTSRDDTLQLILESLQRIELILRVGLDVDVDEAFRKD